jgi:hypothetical protein
MNKTIKKKSKKTNTVKNTSIKKPIFYTLQKGTLLFRTVKDVKSDFAGMVMPETGTNKYCLSKNHNVFFYPYPFVADAIQAVNPLGYYTEHDRMEIFELEKDVKVLWLLKPSLLSRADRLLNKELISCDKVNFYKCKPGRSYDPCITDNFLSKYPDVNGYIGIGRQDGVWVKEAIDKKRIPKKEADYIHIFNDRLNSGVPEIVLYPLQKRVEHYGTYKQFMKKYSDDLNYKHIASLSRSDSNKEIHEFMEKKCVFDKEKKLWILKKN